MTVQELKTSDSATFDDLKPLAGATGPCISIVLPVPKPLELAIRVKNASQTLKKQLAVYGANSAAIASLMKPIEEAAVTAEDSGVWGSALILYRSSDLFRCYVAHTDLKELATVGAHFDVRPLLSVLRRDQQFDLLALSKHHTRLFRCTQGTSVETPMQGLAPESMSAWMNARQPDHTLRNRSAAGPSTGSMKGAPFGTNSDADREDEYVRHFLKSVDEAVNQLLRDAKGPLILAGVDYEVAIYREVSTYPHLSKHAVLGSPDRQTPSELHEHAKEIVRQSFSEPLQEALDTFEKHRDKGHVTHNAREALQAAFQGRAAALFISENAEMKGAWSEETQDIVQPTKGGERKDLFNEAVLQTILHGGQAFSLSPQDMPAGAEAAAVLRF